MSDESRKPKGSESSGATGTDRVPLPTGPRTVLRIVLDGQEVWNPDLTPEETRERVRRSQVVGTDIL